MDCWGDIVFEIRWDLIIQDFVCEEEDLRFGSGFNREPINRSQYGINVPSLMNYDSPG